MADGLDIVRELADPVGTILDTWTRPNGMTIERVRVPLGVVGIIYESRPNVTADAGALCLKAGNAAILRGGSDSYRSSRAIHAALVAGLRDAHLPEDAIQLVPTRDREAVGSMLRGLDDNIDVIVPRGGKSLVARVQNEARVPVFAHLEGVCHVYVDKAADLDMAKTIVLNAKMRRTGVCGSAETLLVDRAAAGKFLKPLVSMLIDAGCEVRGDDAVREADARAKTASDEDWPAEYLDAIIAAKVVDGVERRDRAYRALRLAPHRRDRDRRRQSRREIPGAKSIRRSCFTTPRPNSPTAANSASAPRSGSRPARCMRAAPSASSSSRRSNIGCADRGRRAREGAAANARQKRQQTARFASPPRGRPEDRSVRGLVQSAA